MLVIGDAFAIADENSVGGSLYAVNCNVSMNDISISGNIVKGYGGFMYGWDSRFNIINSFFDRNEADIGGILYIGDSILHISNSEFINNESPYGPCIYAYNSKLILLNNIIQYNIASGLGGLFINASDLQLLNTNASYNYAPNGDACLYFALCFFIYIYIVKYM